MEELDIFAIKCPYPKQEDSDDEEPWSHKKYQKSKTIYKKKFNENKNIYSMEDSENEEILFMGIETQTSNDESDVEGEVYLEVELISSLEEIEKCRRRNKSLKEQSSKYKKE